MRKGVILEINDFYLTLLTPEGEFLRARKHQQDYQVGEEIHFFPETLTVKKKRFNLSFLNSFKARTLALTAAIMLVMTALLPAYQNGQVYAYMSIDVNPSIELAVNDDLKVLRMKGYNPEGKEIIGEMQDWKKRDAAVVAEMILEEIEEEGFFKEKNEIVIATVHNNDSKEAIDKKLEKKISEIKKSRQVKDLNIKVIEATEEDREKAQKQGITTGVYKEKQKGKPKPKTPVKPVEKNKKDHPEPEGKAVDPQPQPEKKEPAGQVKKKDTELPKEKPNKPETPAADKGKGNGNSGMNGNSHSNNDKHDDKGNKNGQDRKQYKKEKKSNNQQGPRSDKRGQAGENKDNRGNKK